MARVRTTVSIHLKVREINEIKGETTARRELGFQETGRTKKKIGGMPQK